MNEHTPHTDILESSRPTLSEAKKATLWQAIEADIHVAPVPSPFLFAYLRKNSVVPFALVIGLLLGAGTTVAASDTARPGDLLFPIDQALEDARLALARNDDTRARLQIAYAEERLNELRSILDEDSTQANDGNPLVPIDATEFEAEADVFTNITIVKVEINDRTTTFETSASTKNAVVDEIVRRYALDRARVESVLDFEIEDRASRASDIATSDDDRILTAIDLFDRSVNAGVISGSEKSRLMSELLEEFHGANRVRVDDDRIEVRDGNERIEIRQKDGQTEVRIKNDDDDDYDDDDDDDDDRDSYNDVDYNDSRRDDTDRDSRDDDNDNQDSEDSDDDNRNDDDEEETDERDNKDDDSRSDNDDDTNDDSNDSSSNDDSDETVRVEVEVEDGVAEVRLEYGGEKEEFTLTYESESALVAAIASRSGLSSSVIGQNLELEIKD